MTNPESVPRPAARRYAPWLLLATLLLAGAAWWWLGRKPEPAAAPAKPIVQVAAVQRRAMPRVLETVGKVVAQASAEVRPQTGGVVRRVLIQDGERVRAGQKLFELDMQPLQASLAQAQAQWARDVALADDAAAAAARLQPLADKEYVSRRDYESAVNTQRSLRATAAASRTLIDQARISLGYATVVAPISGRAGAVLVKPGNLVAANNGTALLVINAMSPVEVAFTLPQAAARQLRDAMQEQPGQPLRVEARDSLTQQLRATGTLQFIDNALDASAGTVALKARFDNGDEKLWPGEFYAVRITLRVDEDAVVVPESAVQQGQAGPFVYVLQGGVATLRPVQVDRTLDGSAVVAKGLVAGETVLSAVPNNLRSGTAVQVAPAASSPASASAAP